MPFPGIWNTVIRRLCLREILTRLFQKIFGGGLLWLTWFFVVRFLRETLSIL